MLKAKVRMSDKVNSELDTIAAFVENKTCQTDIGVDSGLAVTGQYVHICPICKEIHFVNEAKHRLAYGKQYTCSLKCEIERRKTWWHFA